MPNHCIGYLRIKGRNENVDEFVNILKQGYNYDNYNPDDYKHKHMYRIFETNVGEEPVDTYGLTKTIDVGIVCAWSFHSCMFKDGYYYNASTIPEPNKDVFGYDISRDEWINIVKNIQIKNKHHTNIIEAARNLNLIIEGISEESGMAFQEHFAIDRGAIVFDEDSDLVEYFGDNGPNYTYEQFVKDYPRTIVSEEQFNEEIKSDNIIMPYGIIEDTVYVDGADPYPFKRQMCKIVKK